MMPLTYWKMSEETLYSETPWEEFLLWFIFFGCTDPSSPARDRTHAPHSESAVS